MSSDSRDQPLMTSLARFQGAASPSVLRCWSQLARPAVAIAVVRPDGPVRIQAADHPERLLSRYMACVTSSRRRAVLVDQAAETVETYDLVVAAGRASRR